MMLALHSIQRWNVDRTAKPTGHAIFGLISLTAAFAYVPLEQAALAYSPLGKADRTLAAEPRHPEPGEIASGQSRVFIHVYKTGLGHEHAVEGKIQSGTLQLGAQHQAGHMTFDMKSFDADTPLARKYLSLKGHTDDDTRNQVNGNMHSSKVLDSQRFPTATFDIESALARPRPNAESPEQFVLKGTLTLRGVQKPATMVVEIDKQENGYVHVRGQFRIKQTDFGMKPYTAALGAVGVADHLDIHGDAWIKSDNVASEASTAVRPPR